MHKFKGVLNQNYNDSDDDNEESDFNELNNENEIQLESLIQNWFKKYPSNTIKISPHFLGKISTRFYFTISSIEKQYKSNFLGDNMYRRIIALFNAIIVEELKENESTNKRRESKKKLWNLNLDNPVTSDQIFINNLRVAMENKRELKLSTWLLSCPLFLVYLPCDENDFRESKRSMMLSTGRMTNINKDEDKENRLKENYRYLKDLLLNFISVGHEDDEKLTDSLFKNSIFLNLQQVELKTDKRLNNKDQI